MKCEVSILLLRCAITCICGSRSSTKHACHMSTIREGQLDLVASEGKNPYLLTACKLLLLKYYSQFIMTIEKKTVRDPNVSDFGRVLFNTQWGIHITFSLSYRTRLPTSVIATSLPLYFNADLQLAHKETTYWPKYTIKCVGFSIRLSYMMETISLAKPLGNYSYRL